MTKFFSILLFIVSVTPLIAKNRVLNVSVQCLGSKNIVPGTHSQICENKIIRNQFQSLVKKNSSGGLEPSVAKGWRFIDSKTIEFDINSELVFANGKKVQASDVKKSWEHTLSSHLLKKPGYFAYIEGFDNFEKSLELTGIKVLSPYRLKVSLKKGCRTFLNGIVGSHYSVFTIEDGRYIGSGPYVLEVKSPGIILLNKNQNYNFQNSHFDSIVIQSHDNPYYAGQFIQNIDLFFNFINPSTVESGYQDRFKILNGLDSFQFKLMLNSNKYPFDSKKMRKSFLHLLYHDMKISYKSYDFRRDFQPFQLFQFGRLERNILEKSLSIEDQKNIESLKKSTRNNPLCIFSREGDRLVSFLKDNGFQINNDKKCTASSKQNKMVDKNNYHGWIFAHYVSSPDPDHLAYVFRKNSPSIMKTDSNEKLSDMFETGRELLSTSKIKVKYEQIAKELIEEVPTIFLGYLPSQVLFNYRVLEPLIQDHLLLSELDKVVPKTK